MSLIEHRTDRYALRIGVDRDDSLGREGVDTYWLPDDTTFEIEVFEPQWVAGAVSLADVCEFLRSATYPDPACGGTRHVSGWQSAAVALEREFGGRT